tara:strand:+ start:15385 stop:17076 length:1692 start_codon:yes stop_codon:yes gene_type:complete
MLHHYNLIASAIAGRSVTVHHHGSSRYRAYTDGKSVFLPAQEQDNDQISAVIAQALLLRAGSLHRQWLQRMVGQRNLAERYLYAEVCRAARDYQMLLPRCFCEAGPIANFPLNSTDCESSYRLASGKTDFPPMPELIGTLRPVLLLKNSLTDRSTTGLSKKQQAGEFDFTSVNELDDDQEDAEESKILKLFQNPLLSGGKMAEMLNNILGAGRSGKPEEDPNAGGGTEMPIGSISQAKKKGVFATLTDFALDLISDPRDSIGSHRYPEWDFSQKAYREDWCLVDEMDPWREEPASDQSLASVLQPPALNFKRQLAGIGLSFENHRNQQDGEDYTLDRVIDYAVDYRMGITPDERLFNRSMKTRRDLAVMILLDISGSTAEDDSHGESVHFKQMRLAYQLLHALHEFGDQVSLYAFHSWGRTLIRLLRLKSFKEQRIDSRIHQRFSQLEPVGYTRTGAALRHAAHKLDHETGLPYRLLIVITDGFSYDQDYEGKYGEEDTRKALEEIRSNGTGCLCLTIGSSQEEEKLASIYGAASTLASSDHDELVNHLRPAVLKAIQQIKSS